MHLPQLDEVDRLLFETAALVDAVEGQAVDASDRVRSWLVELGSTFQRGNMAAAAAAMAGLRADLLALHLGATPPGLDPAGLGPRRLRRIGILRIIREAEQKASSAVAEARAIFNEARKIVQQIVAVARHKEIPGAPPPGSSGESELRELWLRILADPDLAGAATRVLGMVSEHDALAILHQEL